MAWRRPYLNQCWNIVNWTLMNKLRWKFDENSNVFIQENALENVGCEMASILSRRQCVYRDCLWSFKQFKFPLVTWAQNALQQRYPQSTFRASNYKRYQPIGDHISYPTDSPIATKLWMSSRPSGKLSMQCKKSPTFCRGHLQMHFQMRMNVLAFESKWSNKIWWLCLLSTSTTRFASGVGYRIAKICIWLYKEIIFMNTDIKFLDIEWRTPYPLTNFEDRFGLRASFFLRL